MNSEVDEELEVETEVEVDRGSAVEVVFAAEAEALLVVDVVDVVEVVESFDTFEGSVVESTEVVGLGLGLGLSLSASLSSSGQMPVSQGSLEQHPRNGPFEQTYQSLPVRQVILSLMDRSERGWSKT